MSHIFGSAIVLVEFKVDESDMGVAIQCQQFDEGGLVAR